MTLPTPKLSLSMICLGSRAIAHQALQLQVKGQRKATSEHL